MTTPASPRARRQQAPAAEPVALRQRILDTAEQLLEEQGLAALSLREVARRAGVTHQAPYHHFADRESILAELVTQGFVELTRRLSRANDRLATEAHRHALLQSGEAYVGFALEHAGVFRIMFSRDLCDPARFPSVQAAAEASHGELLRMVGLLHDGAQSETLTSTYWALVHGLAALLIDGPLAEHLPTLAARRAHMRATLQQFVSLVLGPRPD